MRSPVDEMVGYATWATEQVVAACRSLTPAQLDEPLAGGFGSILETLNHVVTSSGHYLGRLWPAFTPIDDEDLDLDGLSSEIARQRPAWADLARAELDADRVTVSRRDDGTFFQATVGIRLLQILQHATDHLSQVNTGLTTFGVEAPWTGGWDYGESTGGVVKYADGPER